jgi:hypothetical protein
MDMSKIENSYVYNKYSSHNYVDDELISHNWLNSYVNIIVGRPIERILLNKWWVFLHERSVKIFRIPCWANFIYLPLSLSQSKACLR